jgi:hypothetical protein
MRLPWGLPMEQVVKNSHFVAKHLTKPWEFTHPKHGARQLYYYDFALDEFEVRAASKLHTLEKPWSQRVEKFLNRYLETPLGTFLSRFNRDRHAQPTELELRAMKATLLLQAPRSADAREELEDLETKGEFYLNTLVMAADDVFSFVHVPLRQARLFFPRHGLITIPMVGAAPAVGIAFHPSYLMVTVPKNHAPFIAQLEVLREQPEDYTAFSAGLEKCRHLVIPGYLWGTDEDALRHNIHVYRKRGTALLEGSMQLNQRLYGTTRPSAAWQTMVPLTPTV